MVQTANGGQEVINDAQHDHKLKPQTSNLSLLLGGADLNNRHLS